jgi:hypothetical protein
VTHHRLAHQCDWHRLQVTSAGLAVTRGEVTRTGWWIDVHTGQHVVPSPMVKAIR